MHFFQVHFTAALHCFCTNVFILLLRGVSAAEVAFSHVYDPLFNLHWLHIGRASSSKWLYLHSKSSIGGCHLEYLAPFSFILPRVHVKKVAFIEHWAVCSVAVLMGGYANVLLTVYSLLYSDTDYLLSVVDFSLQSIIALMTTVCDTWIIVGRGNTGDAENVVQLREQLQSSGVDDSLEFNLRYQHGHYTYTYHCTDIVRRFSSQHCSTAVHGNVCWMRHFIYFLGTFWHCYLSWWFCFCCLVLCNSASCICVAILQYCFKNCKTYVVDNETWLSTQTVDSLQGK